MNFYENIDKNFYEKQAESKNFLRSWFHNSRHKITYKFVKKYYQQGDVIIDLGCGNVLWNYDKIPVIGVDINENFLDFNLKNKSIIKKIVSYLNNINLPDQIADIIIITEVIEHLDNLDIYFKEMYRLLKPGGIIISSVPYDTDLSLWKPLFALQCFYRGQILKEDYYKKNCGHLNHFSKNSIKEIFINYNFKILEQYNNFYFTIFTIVQK